MVFKKISEFLTNDVTVTLGRTEACFEGVRFSVTLLGCVCISADETPTILSVGELYQGEKPFKRVELLPLKNHYDQDEIYCLHSYLKYALDQNSNTLVRPRIFLKNTGHAFSEEQKKILTDGFKAALAKEVYFWNGERRKYE